MAAVMMYCRTFRCGFTGPVLPRCAMRKYQMATVSDAMLSGNFKTMRESQQPQP